MSILQMAWRNVWRNRRRTTVTVAATTLAFTVMVLYSSLVEGYMRGMERNLLDLELGDVQIHSPDYLDDPSLYSAIEESESLLASFDERGYVAAPRLAGFGLAAAGDAAAGVQLLGIDVARDGRVSKVADQVAEGAWLDAGEPGGVVLGRRLATTLRVHAGDELVILSQASDGSTANDLFVVRGILGLSGESMDRAGVLITEEAFRRFFVFPEGAHEIILRRPPGSDLDAFAGDIRALAPGERVETWREIAPTLATLLDSARGLMVFVFLIVYVAIGILILNAMLMAVFERIREFGVLKAIGYSPGQVFSIIMVECGIQVALAICVGLALAVPGLWYLSAVGIDLGKLGGMALMGIVLDPTWRGVVEPDVFAGPLLTLVFVVALAALYPAMKAALLSPIRAIQHR